MTTAVAPDFVHAVVRVTGEDYGNLLVQRSVDFAPFGGLLYPAYADETLHPFCWISSSSCGIAAIPTATPNR